MIDERRLRESRVERRADARADRGLHHVAVETTLPEGSEVVVLTRGDEESFELDDAALGELEKRMAEADNGEVEPLEAVLAKLRRTVAIAARFHEPSQK